MGQAVSVMHDGGSEAFGRTTEAGRALALSGHKGCQINQMSSTRQAGDYCPAVRVAHNEGRFSHGVNDCLHRFGVGQKRATMQFRNSDLDSGSSQLPNHQVEVPWVVVQTVHQHDTIHEDPQFSRACTSPAAMIACAASVTPEAHVCAGGESGPTEHLALEHLDAVYVSFDDAGTPGQGESGDDGIAITVDACGEGVDGGQVVLSDGVEPLR